jgi:hypothetical protein
MVNEWQMGGVLCFWRFTFDQGKLWSRTQPVRVLLRIERLVRHRWPLPRTRRGKVKFAALERSVEERFAFNADGQNS